MDLIKQNWEWLLQNPWGASALALALIAIVWAVARAFYQERIELLRERLSSLTATDVPTTTFVYPHAGRYGKNVLSNSTTTVAINEVVSLRAEVPVDSKLHILIQGPDEVASDESTERIGAWYWSVGHNHNWIPGGYDFANGGVQGFDAEGGWADMQLVFAKPGAIRIVAFEAGAQAASWSRTMNVRQV